MTGPDHRSPACDDFTRRLPELGLSRLVAFVGLAEELHFGRAAAKLHISQPALSQQIAHLERSVAATLFDRGGRRVRLTAAGRVLLRGCRSTIDTMERTVADARGAAEAGATVLSYTDGSPRLFVERLGAALDAALPMAVTLVRHTVSEQRELVAAGSAYAGVSLSGAYGGEDIRVTRVGDDPFLLLTGTETVPLRDLGPRLVRAADSTYACWRCLLDSGCHPTCPVAAVDDVVAEVASGRGSAVIPRSVADALRHARIRPVPLPGIPPVSVWLTCAGWASSAEYTHLLGTGRAVWAGLTAA
jgi:DNA-binding transcriptional LysR family regulator